MYFQAGYEQYGTYRRQALLQEAAQRRLLDLARPAGPTGRRVPRRPGPRQIAGQWLVDLGRRLQGLPARA